MTKRAAWSLVFVASVVGYAMAITFGDWVSCLLALPLLVAAVAAFAYLYAGGLGTDLPDRESGA